MRAQSHKLFKTHSTVKAYTKDHIDSLDNNREQTGGYRPGDVLRKADGTLLVVVQVVTKDGEDNPDYDYAWVVCVDAEGGSEEPSRQQAAMWKGNFAKNGQGEKPLPSFRDLVLGWNDQFKDGDQYIIPVPPECAALSHRTHQRRPLQRCTDIPG